MCFSPNHTPYTESGHKEIHKELNRMIKKTLSFIWENPLFKNSIEFNDNRIAKWVASKGKCYITGEYLGHVFHCHHIIPRNVGGSDAYNNLVIFSAEAHKLVHAKDLTLITNLLNIYELKSKELKKLNKLRELVGNENL